MSEHFEVERRTHEIRRLIGEAIRLLSRAEDQATDLLWLEVDYGETDAAALEPDEELSATAEDGLGTH